MSSRNAYLLRKYGITEEEYKAIVQRQGGKCAICNRKPRKRLCVDHDHDTGRVRGAICGRCNRSLAPFEWSAEVAERASIYLHDIAINKPQD